MQMSHSSDNTGQKGVNAVEAIFLDMGWLFRRQLESDFGIDAQAEIVEEGRPTGQLIALQIKSGPSFFTKKKGNDFVFYGRSRHLEYWENHSLPVILVLHNPESGLTLWQRVERHRVTEGKDGSWSIAIPPYMTLDKASGPHITEAIPRSDPENVRRRRTALDADLIRKIAAIGCAYVVIDEWINKSLNFRGAKLRFEEPEDDEAEGNSVDFYLPARSVSVVFDLLFPWLSFVYDRPPYEDNAEVTVHTFRVELNDLGRAFLSLEDFYRDGAEPSDEPEIPEPDEDSMDEGEWDEYQFQRALAKDWEDEANEPRPDES